MLHTSQGVGNGVQLAVVASARAGSKECPHKQSPLYTHP